MKITHWLGLGCFVIAGVAGAMLIEPVGSYFLVDPFTAIIVSGLFAVIGLIAGFVLPAKSTEQKNLSWLLIVGSAVFLGITIWFFLSLRGEF